MPLFVPPNLKDMHITITYEKEKQKILTFEKLKPGNFWTFQLRLTKIMSWWKQLIIHFQWIDWLINLSLWLYIVHCSRSLSLEAELSQWIFTANYSVNIYLFFNTENNMFLFYVLKLGQCCLIMIWKEQPGVLHESNDLLTSLIFKSK